MVIVVFVTIVVGTTAGLSHLAQVDVRRHCHRHRSLRLAMGTRPRCGSRRGSGAHRPIPARRGHPSTRGEKLTRKALPFFATCVVAELEQHVVTQTSDFKKHRYPDWVGIDQRIKIGGALLVLQLQLELQL